MRITEIGTVDGVATFVRGDIGGNSGLLYRCECCPNGHHIWSRHIETADGRSSGTFVRDLLILHPELENKRIRLTLSVIDDG